MAENASSGLGNSNSCVEEEAQEFVLKPREEQLEEHRLNGRDKKKKSKNRKNKDIEEKESTTEKEDKGTRLLYNETPSDDEEKSERVLPSPKRVKTNENCKKPPPFSKVWSDEDEISLLRGMIKFKEETGRDAGQNMMEFRRFILESLVLQATLVQLREKVRRLREKYEKSVGSGNGSRTLHEVELFQLCEKIWTVNPKQVTEQPNSSGTGQREQQNLLVNGQGEKQNIPEIGRQRQQSILEIGRQGQQNIPEIGRPRQHNIIPETGLNAQTLEALYERVSKDIELVINSKACLRGNEKEVDIRSFGLYLDSLKLRIKLGTLVKEKANSPELRDSPELREQEVLRSYLEAKIEHTQLLLNAYNSFIKDHSDEA